MIRLFLAITLTTAVSTAVVINWGQEEINAFKIRCTEARGNHIEQFGTAMSSWACLTKNGRILNIEGPGL